MKRIAAFIGILVVAAGCSLGEVLRDPGDPVDMTPQSLAGTWHAGRERFITFNEDGTFSATNLPQAPFRDFLNDVGWTTASGRLDGSGQWRLHAVGTLPGHRSPDATPRPPDMRPTAPLARVHLDFDVLAGVAPARYGGPDLHALRPGDGKIYLVLFYVDQGKCWTAYQRCGSGCVPATPSAPAATTPRRSSSPPMPAPLNP